MKLNLGIDFDGVITDPTELKIDWIKKHCGIVLMPHETVKQSAIVKIGKPAYREMIKDCYAGDLALKNKIRPEAVSVLLKLIKQGHEIHIITSRFDDELVKAKMLVELNNIPYTTINNTSEEPKNDICKKLKVNIFLDDGQEKLEKLKSIPDMKLVFFNAFGELCCDSFIQVKNWEEFFLLVSGEKKA